MSCKSSNTWESKKPYFKWAKNTQFNIVPDRHDKDYALG